MQLRPPRSTRTATLFPSTPLFRSAGTGLFGLREPAGTDRGPLPAFGPARRGGGDAVRLGTRGDPRADRFALGRRCDDPDRLCRRGRALSGRRVAVHAVGVAARRGRRGAVAERKTVGWGKSVAVSVDNGGG